MERIPCGMPGVQASPLMTDWYQFTMLAAYHDSGLAQNAVFELSVRSMPRSRRFLMCSGLALVVAYLEQLQFGDAELSWLEQTGRFRRDFLERLAVWRFTGDVDAMPEGTVFFAEEPILRITAPIAEAQFVESRVLNLMHYASLIASKAARCVVAARGKTLIDFGMRRAHGAEAALIAARAAWLAGFDGTATVLANACWDIPLVGTMAHSFIEVFEREAEAFWFFAQSQPRHVTLLLDTYDTERAAHTVVAWAPRLREAGIVLQAVRLDSGDLAHHARQVRGILDAGGLSSVRVFASGGLDEMRVARLAEQAPIDGFGIGTALTTSADVPALDAVYKLTAYAGMPRRKRSEGKAGWPGAKQVYRHLNTDGTWLQDTVHRIEEPAPVGALPLLEPVLRGGQRVAEVPSLEHSRARAVAQLAAMPAALRGLAPWSATPDYPVHISPALHHLADWVDHQTR